MTAVKKREKPSGLETEAIWRIENWLSAYRAGQGTGSLAERAELIRSILDDYHGTKRLRLDVICPALGCTMRSLQREFKLQYGVSMNEFQDRARLHRAIWYMKVTPDVKMSALASELGYDRLSEFSRFFRNKTGMSPRAYLDHLTKWGSDDASHEEGC
jgi:AraC-like DNA-binding protein